MIFFRLRNNPQIPTKKRVKDTPKILNKLIGIFSLFYATWAFTPFDQVAVSQPPTIGQNTKYFSSKIPQVFNWVPLAPGLGRSPQLRGKI